MSSQTKDLELSKTLKASKRFQVKEILWSPIEEGLQGVFHLQTTMFSFKRLIIIEATTSVRQTSSLETQFFLSFQIP